MAASEMYAAGAAAGGDEYEPRLLRRAAGFLSRSGWTLLIVPAVVLVVLVFAYPVGTIISRTFTDHTGSPGGWTANLEWFFGSSAQVKILLRTLSTAGVVTLICLLVCYPYAYLMTIVTTRWRVVLLGVAVISAWQSILVRNYAWRVILRDNGIFNDIISWLGFDRVHLLGTTTGVTIGMTQVMAPFMILSLYAGLRNVDRRLLTAARSLGANPAKAFVGIYLPLSLPGVIAGCLLVGVLTLGFFITPALLGSPQNSLISQAIVLQLNRTLDWGHAGAQSFVLLFAAIGILGVIGMAVRNRIKAVIG